ncbi:hypothetical protein ACH5RR_008384 [Cinchona calisaya]|uniref:Uncharacterized protein n=1 Tax=Cinchona calisaya TaxID=153742 RepID=A0ABD3ABH4_9GENT
MAQSGRRRQRKFQEEARNKIFGDWGRSMEEPKGVEEEDKESDDEEESDDDDDDEEEEIDDDVATLRKIRMRNDSNSWPSSKIKEADEEERRASFHRPISARSVYGTDELEKNSEVKHLAIDALRRYNSEQAPHRAAFGDESEQN